MKYNNESRVINYDKNIEVRNIGTECTEYMKIFGANNNLMRHIPGIIDGLKPGERRILWSLYKNNVHYNGNHKKVETLVGQVLDYHPHGPSPLYETLVKMAQDWNNLQCLIDGHGNFGSPQGDSAAAGRYIEAKLSYYAYKCFFEEFSEKIVDMKPNYSDEKLEPEYLPAKYPNVLINTSFGIGYGMSCGIPSYNFKEVIELTLKLMDDPDYEDCTLYPDLPTRCDIVDEGQFKEISETGQGKFKMRGNIEIDDNSNSVFITSTPFQANVIDIKHDMISKKDKDGNAKKEKIPGIRDIRDLSPKVIRYKDLNPFFKIQFLLKKELDPYTVRQQIFAKTSMQDSFNVNFKLIDDYQDKDYSIRSLLLDWIDYRRETKRRLYNHKLTEAMERQHTLTTLIWVTNAKNAEDTVSMIKQSENTKEAAQRLMSAYKITSLQAQSLCKMPLSSFTKEAHLRYIKEKEDTDDKVEKYSKIVRSVKKIDKIIREELEEGIKLFGEERRSKIITIDGEMKIRDTLHRVLFTKEGFVKKLPENVTTIGFINNNDFPIEFLFVKNTTDLLIFDESGKISKLPIHQLPNSELNKEGEKLSKYCTINGDIKAIIPKPTEESLLELWEKYKTYTYFLMITKKGIIKKTAASQFTNIKNGLIGMITKDNDAFKEVKLLAGDKDVLIYTSKGFGIRMPTTDIKETSRMSQGVKAIELSDGEEVIGMDIINNNDKYLFALTNKGTGKKSPLNTFPVMERNSKPLRIISLEDEEYISAIKTVKGNEEFQAFLKNNSETIKIEDVIELPRLSKGRKLIPVKKGELIIDVKEIKKG